MNGNNETAMYRVALLILRVIYPLTWRLRHEDEMRDIFDHHRVSVAMMLDLLRVGIALRLTNSSSSQ